MNEETLFENVHEAMTNFAQSLLDAFENQGISPRNLVLGLASALDARNYDKRVVLLLEQAASIKNQDK